MYASNSNCNSIKLLHPVSNSRHVTWPQTNISDCSPLITMDNRVHSMGSSKNREWIGVKWHTQLSALALVNISGILLNIIQCMACNLRWVGWRLDVLLFKSKMFLVEMYFEPLEITWLTKKRNTLWILYVKNKTYSSISTKITFLPYFIHLPTGLISLVAPPIRKIAVCPKLKEINGQDRSDS